MGYVMSTRTEVPDKFTRSEALTAWTAVNPGAAKKLAAGDKPAFIEPLLIIALAVAGALGIALVYAAIVVPILEQVASTLAVTL